MSSALADRSTPALEDELATLAAHIQAATARLLALLAELDRREAWASTGALSCAHWLAWRTGLDLGAAREHVRVARALTALPALRTAFDRGELSFSKVRAVTRIARPETEADLLATAREGTAAQLERLVRAYRRADPVAENAQAQAQQEARFVHTRWAEDGMLVVELRHGPDGALAAGRKTRVISAPLRRALRARDGGCVFPGCTNRRCDGHHLRHWAAGGPTTLDNTCLLCDRHHILVHEGGWRVERAPDGRLRFIRPDESEQTAPPPRGGATPVADLCAAQAALALTPTTLRPTWEGGAVDYEWGAAALWHLTTAGRS